MSFPRIMKAEGMWNIGSKVVTKVYKRLQGRVSSLHFRAPHVSRVAFLLTVIELARLCVQILLFA
jgi:hypothetical protein